MKKLIQFKNIVKYFDGQLILKGINLDIYENEFVTLLGPSGCGKTTLLRILGGFLQPTEGKVLFAGEDIVNIPPYKREINTVFQKYALFPHLNVYDNVAFGLKLKGEPADIIEQKVTRMLKLVGLADFEIAESMRCLADSSSVWLSPARSLTSPRSCCSTSLWERSMRSSARRCRRS